MLHFEDIIWYLSSVQSLCWIDYSEIELEYSLEKQKTEDNSPNDCEFSGQIFYDLYRKDDYGICICSFIAYFCDGDLDDIEKKITDQIRYEFFVSKCKDVIRHQLMSKILDL